MGRRGDCLPLAAGYGLVTMVASLLSSIPCYYLYLIQWVLKGKFRHCQDTLKKQGLGNPV